LTMILRSLTSITDLLPTVIAWYQLCGHKIESLCILNQNNEAGLSEMGKLAKNAQFMLNAGFGLDRWIFWRVLLKRDSCCGNEEIAPLALKAWKIMKFWGERVECMGGTK